MATAEPASGDVAARPRSPRVAARRAGTRAEILDAAWQLAREVGLTGFSLRELAAEVDMQAPSLYEYFAGKDAIYDAMFAQGNREFLARVERIPPPVPGERRATLIAGARTFVEFATQDPVRFQLLFQHAITGWEPSEEAYAPALEAYELMERHLAAMGVDDPRSLDLWTAMTSGLAHQQVANDPDGHRWYDLVETTVDLFLHHLDQQRHDQE